MVDLPNSDEAAAEPRRDVAAGCNVFFLAILLLLFAILAFWAWQRNPPATPQPEKAGVPESQGGRNAT